MLPILAEESLPTWVVVITALIGGPVCGVLGGAVMWVVSEKRKRRAEERQNIKDDKRDSLQEYKDLLAAQRKEKDQSLQNMQVRLDAQESRVSDLLIRVGKAETAEAKCQGRVAQLESELRLYNIQIRRLQERVHDAPPGVTMPCQVIASIPDGIIADVTTEAGSMFHWTPEELRGRPITLLMPRDVRAVHKRGLDKLIADKRIADPNKPVFTFGVTQDGRRFPIVINLSGPWIGRDGVTKYINAEIRRRGDSDEVLLHGPGPWAGMDADGTDPSKDTAEAPALQVEEENKK